MSDGLTDKINEARSVAIRHIGINTYSSGKIRFFLMSKGYDSNIADEVVRELVSREYIDDYRASRRILYGRTGKKQESRAYCLNRLLQGGVSESVAEEYVSGLETDSVTCWYLFDSLCPNKEEACREKLIKKSLSRGYTYELASSTYSKWIKI